VGVAFAGAPRRGLPLFAALVTVGVLGGAVTHGMRRATRALRVAEQRARAQRLSHYRTRTSVGAQDGS
jgi:hypothetical protein